MAERLRCRVGRHLWYWDADAPEKQTCLHCHATRRQQKTALCYLGLHDWIPFVHDGARYLACRRCGHYGGDPGSFNWVPNRNRDL